MKEQYKNTSKLRAIKIKNIRFVIEEAERIIKESKITQAALTSLRKQIAISNQELEILYLWGKEKNQIQE